MGNGAFFGGVASGFLASQKAMSDANESSARADLLRAQAEEHRAKRQANEDAGRAMEDGLRISSGDFGLRKPPSQTVAPPATAPSIETTFHVPGVGYVKDEATAKAMAENMAFDEPAAAPATAYRVGGNTYGKAEDAIAASEQAASTPPPAPTAAATQTADDDLAFYRRNAVPRAVASFIKSGQPQAAKMFIDFMRDEAGQRYAGEWLKGMRSVEAGDFDAAIPHLATLYNRDRPDGRRVSWKSLGDGRYQVEQFDENTGALVASKELSAEDLSRLALTTLSPAAHVKWTLDRQGEQRKQEFEMRKMAERETLNEQRDAARDDRRDDRQMQSLDAMDRRQSRQLAAMEQRISKGQMPTLTQQARNDEIQAAREKVADITDEEIKRRTAKFTATGRENPNFDPNLERAARLAGRRMVGDDPAFDSRTAAPQQAPVQAANDVARRFQTDPAMKGRKMGKQTERGVEVLDASGKLLGHYR